MWKPEIPEELYATMDERYVYEALRSSGFVPGLGLPPYVKGGYCNYPDECVATVKYMSLGVLADAIWCTLENAHERWLKENVTEEVMLAEASANCLNAFAPRFELVGAEVFNIWAKKFQQLFTPLGIPFDLGLGTSSFERVMLQMEEHNFRQPSLMNSIFVANRRRFAEDAKLADKGDVFRFLLDGHTGFDENFLFRQARQIIRANGDLAPIEW